MNKYFISLFIISTCLLCSCNYRVNQQNEKILTSVVHLLDNQPDSAYSLLNTVIVKKLSESQYYRFITLQVNIKDKLDMNAAEDTVVFRAMNYFLKKNNAEYKLISCFVSAKVQEEQNNQEKAIMYYFEAIKWLNETHNFLLNGDVYYNLARLLCYMNQYENSLLYLKKGQKYYDLANCSYDYKIHVNELFAINYLYLNNLDSSLLFYKSAENIAIQEKDSCNEQRIAHNMAVIYCEAKEFKTARDKCLQALNLTDITDSLNLGRLHLTLGKIYYGMHDAIFKDSAVICLYKAEKLLQKSSYPNDLIDLYKLFVQVEAKNGNYERSSYYQEQLNKQLNTQKNTEEAAQAIIKKYQDHTFQLMKAERDQYATQRLILFCIVIILSLFLAITLLVFFYKRTFKAFKETAKKKFYLLRAEKEDSDKEKAQMKTKFHEELSVLRSICENEHLRFICQLSNTIALDTILNTKGSSSNYDKIREQVRGMLKSVNFEDIYQKENDLYEGVLDSLKAEPEIAALNEQDFIIFILSCIGFGKYDIAFIINKSDSTVRSRQWNLRKALGIKPGGYFQDYFQEYLKKYRQ